MLANGRWDLTRGLTLILLTWRIWWAPNNASSWQVGFNSVSKVLRNFLYPRSERQSLWLRSTGQITRCIVTFATGMFHSYSYLNSFLRFKFLIFDTCLLTSARMWQCDPLVLFEAKRGPRARDLGKTGVKSEVTAPRYTDGRFGFVFGVFWWSH